MNIDINKLTQDINEFKRYFAEKEPVALMKPLEDEVNEEMDTPQYKEQKQDAKFLVKCFKYLKKLGYIKSQYEFSEQFLRKNKYYFVRL